MTVVSPSPSDREPAEIKVQVPWKLHQAIIRIQAQDDVNFTDACLKAAVIIDPRREEYQKAVLGEADRLAKSRAMTQLNKARTTIRKEAFNECASYVRQNEDNFRVPCPTCGLPMRLSSLSADWPTVRETLYRAFQGWRHTRCPSQQTVKANP